MYMYTALINWKKKKADDKIYICQIPKVVHSSYMYIALRSQG